MKESEARSQLISWLRSDINRRAEALESWAVAFTKSLAVAELEDGDGVFEAATRLEVSRYCLRALDGDPTTAVKLKALYEHVLAQTLRLTKRGSISTSQSTNFVRQCRAQAWAEMEEMIRAYRENITAS